MEERAGKEQAKEMSMPPVPDGATVEGLWEKLHHEREMWRQMVAQKEQEKQAGILQITKVNNMVLAQVCQTMGSWKPKDNEFVLEIPQPKGTWAVKAKKLKSGNYELHAKKIEA